LSTGAEASSPGPIRLAEPRDAAAVRALVQRAYDHYVPRIGLRPAPMDADYEELTRQGLVHVAESTGLAGVLVLRAEPDHLLIENVAVEPSRQGSGIGKALMRFAEQVADRLQVAEVRLYTHERMVENIAFYESLGYEVTERRPEKGFKRVFMRKRLAPSA
jgi:ribosomal protein S18 acetylase RimI-like enzyme